MMPSLSAILRHVFGDVSASTVTDDGYLTVSFGSTPLNGGVFGAVGGAAVGAAVLLPALAHARQLAEDQALHERQKALRGIQDEVDKERTRIEKDKAARERAQSESREKPAPAPEDKP